MRRPSSGQLLRELAADECRLDLFAVIVWVPGGDVGKPPDAAARGVQLGRRQAADQRPELSPASAQVIGCIVLGEIASSARVRRVEVVNDGWAELRLGARKDVADPAADVVVSVRDMVGNHAHRSGVALVAQRAGIPVPLLAGFDELQHPVDRGSDGCRVIRRAKLLSHGPDYSDKAAPRHQAQKPHSVTQRCECYRIRSDSIRDVLGCH